MNDQEQAALSAFKEAMHSLENENYRMKEIISKDAVEIGNQKRLITEMADALELIQFDNHFPDWKSVNKLIQRSREAAQ